MSGLGALKNLDTEATKEVEIPTSASSSATKLSESLAQQGDKSTKRVGEGRLSLLASPHIRNPESHAPRQGCREKGNPTTERPWLEVLKSLKEKTPEEDKRRTNTV